MKVWTVCKRILSTNPIYWLTFYLILLGCAATYGFYVDSQQDEKRCEAFNRAREEAAVIVIETLIEVAGGEAEPERITQVRERLRKNLDEVRVDC